MHVITVVGSHHHAWPTIYLLMCIEPPSAPRNLTLTARPDNLTVHWTQPAELGGRADLFYIMESYDFDNFASFVNLDGTITSYTVTGLRPYTQYCVRVTAHNGVSDQDPDGTHLRTVEECVRTDERRKLILYVMHQCQHHQSTTAPGVVTGLEGRYPYVVWNPPEEPNGVITGYRLRFTRSSTTHTVTTNHDKTFYIIKSHDIPWTSGTFTAMVSACEWCMAGNFLGLLNFIVHVH